MPWSLTACATPLRSSSNAPLLLKCLISSFWRVLRDCSRDFFLHLYYGTTVNCASIFLASCTAYCFTSCLVVFLLFLIQLHVFALKLLLAVYRRYKVYSSEIWYWVLASSGPLHCSSLAISAASRRRCFHERSVCYHVCVNKDLLPPQPASAFSERTFIYLFSALLHCTCDNL